MKLLLDTHLLLRAAGEPAIHSDPFDRLLIAQARIEGFLLLTSDPVVARYGAPPQCISFPGAKKSPGSDPGAFRFLRLEPGCPGQNA